MALRAGKYKHLFPQNEKTIDNSRKDADIFVQKPLFGNNMKKENVKVLHTGAPLVARQEKNGGRTAIALEIRNMRRGDNGCLTPVGKYEQVEKSDGSWMPLGHIGGRLIAASGTSVKAVAVDGSGAAPLSADTSLPGPALCAVPSSDDSLTVMTASGPARIVISGQSLQIIRLSPSFPTIILAATDSTPVTADVAARTLSRSYTSGRLGNADARSVTADITAAYMHISAESAAAGLFIQPVLARYKLRDRSGQLLYTSAPVLLCHTAGAQCCEGTEIYSDDRSTLKPYTLSAQSWKLSATVCDSQSLRASEVATAEIWISPQFHPCNPDCDSTISVGRATSAGSPFLHVRLPGSQNGLGSNWQGRADRILMSAIARMDDIEERVAVISQPFAEGERTIDITASPDPDAAAVARRLSAALKAPVRRRPAAGILLSPPHTFCAKTAASDASTVAWGNLSVQRFTGYPAQTFTARTGQDGAWRIYSKVRFFDGSSLARTDEGSGPVPRLLGPVLSYPSPDAAEIDMQITAGGQSVMARFPLTPDESGRYSVFIAPTVRPFAPVSESIPDIAFTQPPQDRMPDTIAVADAARPLSPDICGRPGGGEIRALEASRISSQSWEFGRCRFIAGTAEGLYAVGVGANRKSLSLRHIFDGAVASQAPLVAAGTSVFALAGSGPAVVEIPPSGNAVVFAGPDGYSALSFNVLRNELTAFRTDGLARVFCLDENGDSYTRTETGVLAVAAPYVITSSGIFRTDRETPARMPVRIKYHVDPQGYTFSRIRKLDASLCASSVSAAIALEGAGISDGKPWPILSAEIRGEIRSPLALHPLARPARTVILTFDGFASEDFKFKSFRLTVS